MASLKIHSGHTIFRSLSLAHLRLASLVDGILKKDPLRIPNSLELIEQVVDPW